MSFERLLDEGKIEEVEKKDFDLALAERDLKAAKNNLKMKDYDWALSIAYNAVLQSGRAVMFNIGFRPKGKDAHKTVFEFLQGAGFDKGLLLYFDNIRKARHTAVYDQADAVSESNASEAIIKAEEFVQKIRTFVQKIRTEKLMELLGQNSGISIAELAEKIGIGAAEIEDDISALAEKGLIERIGPAKGGKWKVVEK